MDVLHIQPTKRLEPNSLLRNLTDPTHWLPRYNELIVHRLVPFHVNCYCDKLLIYNVFHLAAIFAFSKYTERALSFRFSFLVSRLFSEFYFPAGP